MDTRLEIKPHTGLRGVAAVLVVMYHLQFGVSYHLRFEDVTLFFNRCYLLVDLFFIMSGFIIAYVNLEPGKEIAVLKMRPFIIRRLIRLYPLLFCTLVYFSLAMGLAEIFRSNHGGRSGDSWGFESLTILLTQFMMVNAWTTLPTGWNVPSWSISAELAAYLLFPLLITLRQLSPSLAGFLLVFIPVTFYSWIATSNGSLDIVNGIAPVRCLAGFSLGILIFLARDRLERVSTPVLNLAQLIGVACSLIVLSCPINDVMVIPPFLTIVAATSTSRGLVADMLSLRPILYVGKVSYSIYLNHVCLIVLLRLGWDKLVASRAPSPDLERALWLLIYLTVVFLFSIVTYHLVEVRARAYLARRLLGSRPAAITGSPPGP